MGRGWIVFSGCVTVAVDPGGLAGGNRVPFAISSSKSASKSLSESSSNNSSGRLILEVRRRYRFDLAAKNNYTRSDHVIRSRSPFSRDECWEEKKNFQNP